jgi:hypothetical protein
MILHIVLYQPKSSATRKKLLELASALEAASREIPSITQVRVGGTVDFGFAHKNWPKDQDSGNVAVFEFEDQTVLEGYLAHPVHKKLAALFWSTQQRRQMFWSNG